MWGVTLTAVDLIAISVFAITMIIFSGRLSNLERQIRMIREENHYILSIAASERVQKVLRELNGEDRDG